jgi:GR25 family glycosyltransferase involved in LPS biosynthesis
MEKIDRIYYINLTERIDRNEHFLKEMQKINIDMSKIQRISAIKHIKGYIGCGLSQISALKDAIENKYKNIMIFEDDFKFEIDKYVFSNKIEWFFNNHNDYNICCMAYNLTKGNLINNQLVEIHNSYCASGYIISEKFIPILLECFVDAVTCLLNGATQASASIDVKWRYLQGKDKKFYGFYPRLGKQMASYSDIENKFVSYNC